MTFKGLRLIAMGLALASPLPGAAQMAGDPKQGRDVAAGLCAQCHRLGATDRDERRSPPDFAVIAQMPSTTATALQVFLQTPHGDMPRYQLTPTEMDDVVAFILALRSP